MNSFPYILTQYLVVEQLRTNTNVEASDKTLTSVLYSLRIIHNQGANGKTYCPFVFIRGNSWLTVNQEILDYLANNKDFQKCAVWIYENIILKTNIDLYNTISVRIRIASSMLRSILKKSLYIYVCDALIANINDLQKKLIDEELPFQVAPVSP